MLQEVGEQAYVPHICFGVHLRGNNFSLESTLRILDVSDKGQGHKSIGVHNRNVDQVGLGRNMQSACQRHWCIGNANENDLLTLVHLFHIHSLYSFPFAFLIKTYTNH